MNKIWIATAFLSIGVSLNAQEPAKKNDPKPGSSQQRSINEKGLSSTPKTRAIKPKKKDNAINQAPAPTPSSTVTTKKEEKKPE